MGIAISQVQPLSSGRGFVAAFQSPDQVILLAVPPSRCSTWVPSAFTEKLEDPTAQVLTVNNDGHMVIALDGRATPLGLTGTHQLGVLIVALKGDIESCAIGNDPGLGFLDNRGAPREAYELSDFKGSLPTRIGEIAINLGSDFRRGKIEALPLPRSTCPNGAYHEKGDECCARRL